MQDFLSNGHWDTVTLPRYKIDNDVEVPGPYNDAMCDHMRQLYVSNSVYRYWMRKLSDRAFLAIQTDTYAEVHQECDKAFRELHLYAHTEVTFN
jgi:hypothetical protein